MQKTVLTLILVSIVYLCKSQIGIKVDGPIILSNSENLTPVAGTIRWTGSDFEGWNGNEWLSLTIGNSNKEQLYFLGSDQFDNNIRLFSDTINVLGELTERSIWKFLPNHIPTDAKRVDKQGEISVIIAAHGSIYQVPVNYHDKYVYANTYTSCHSVEILPGGNMVSANSTHNKLTLHFNKQEEADKFRFIKSYDIYFEKAHGHDLFPDENGDLLVTSRQGVLKFNINSLENPVFESLVYADYDIKSVVSDIYSGDIYITSPSDISGYATWQTDKIINTTQSKHFIRPFAKFYKVRLWQKNYFSYD